MIALEPPPKKRRNREVERAASRKYLATHCRICREKIAPGTWTCPDCRRVLDQLSWSERPRSADDPDHGERQRRVELYRLSTEDMGFNRTRGVAKAVGADGGERVLRCNSGPSAVAKNRYGIPGDIPLSWDAFAAHLSG